MKFCQNEREADAGQPDAGGDERYLFQRGEKRVRIGQDQQYAVMIGKRQIKTGRAQAKRPARAVAVEQTDGLRGKQQPLPQRAERQDDVQQRSKPVGRDKSRERAAQTARRKPENRRGACRQQKGGAAYEGRVRLGPRVGRAAQQREQQNAAEADAEGREDLREGNRVLGEKMDGKGEQHRSAREQQRKRSLNRERCIFRVLPRGLDLRRQRGALLALGKVLRNKLSGLVGAVARAPAAQQIADDATDFLCHLKNLLTVK